jgi:hypothetical protein
LKRCIAVIPANPGSGPGQAPESSYFKYLKILWTPVSTGVTTFYDNINFNLLPLLKGGREGFSGHFQMAKLLLSTGVTTFYETIKVIS